MTRLPILILLIAGLFVPQVFATITTISTDTFGTGVNCTGTSFDCGTTTDRIIDQNKDYLVNLSIDDGLTTMVCATTLNGITATVVSCLYRNNFLPTSCDSFTEIQSANHSEFYNCTASMTGCGWGYNSVPNFGTTITTKNYQIPTGVLNITHSLFTSYICNGTIINSSQQTENEYFRISNTKSIVCRGTGYDSIIYDVNGTAFLGGTNSCSTNSFCDPGTITNFSMTQNITQRFCTPGCYDSVQDGSETDVDYGGVICGNCSPLGKIKDEFYPMARALQEDNSSFLGVNNYFDEVSYCPIGEQVSGGVITMFLMILLISGIVFVILVFLNIGIFGIAAIIIGRFLKRKKKRP